MCRKIKRPFPPPAACAPRAGVSPHAHGCLALESGRHTPPNHAVEPTPNSLRSCVAPAIARGSPPAFGGDRSFYKTLREPGTEARSEAARAGLAAILRIAKTASSFIRTGKVGGANMRNFIIAAMNLAGGATAVLAQSSSPNGVKTL